VGTENVRIPWHTDPGLIRKTTAAGKLSMIFSSQ
jgi:hypothetical protein